jgi:hypothetical protein
MSQKMRPGKLTLAAVFLALLNSAPGLAADPVVGETTVLGPFTGEGATLHPDNVSPIPILYYGTDLGFTYEHQGQLHILFGDTMATEDGEPIEATTGRKFEDSFGTINMAEWSNPAEFSAENIPVIRLGQNPGTNETSAIDPGHALEGFKTPVGGFSNGSREFGVFFTFKPEGCRKDDDCSGGMQCDAGIGFIGPAYTDDEGITFGCIDGSSQACIAETMTDDGGAPSGGTGFCVDRSSTVWADTAIGRTSSIGVKLLIGTRSASDPSVYSTDHVWLTNKFLNVAIRTVGDFVPASGEMQARQDFRPAVGPGHNKGTQPRVFLWGRPGFIGVNRTGRSLGSYFAYADLPAGPDYAWHLKYFTGVNGQGVPQFSTLERDAAALDLDSSRTGIQPGEVHDVVDQVSVAWVDHLQKWVMFYGGGMINLPMEPTLPQCGILELFTGPECTQVVIGHGAFRMRTADHPWGPWSPPQDIIEGGDPAIPGSGQYGAGGMLRHPACTAQGCAPHTRARDLNVNEYGFFYSANIIEQWTRPVGDSVDLIWNASTWDPYRVILLRTRIDP